ncbi:MAG: hypothetical protein ABJB12_11375 [Pseudomonadota bacterium]
MSSGKSVGAAEADPLVELQRALVTSNDAALHGSSALLGIVAEQRARFAVQAKLIVQKANACVPAASATEVALALGVLVTLFTPAPAPAELG